MTWQFHGKKDPLNQETALEGGDLNYYQHELQETENMKNGMTQREAHIRAFEQLGHSPFAVYGPDVIKAFPGEFAPLWFDYWGISK